MRYAMIKNKKIDNIIIADYTMAQEMAKLGGYEIAVNCDSYPVNIGDLYENGNFMNMSDIIDPETSLIVIPARTIIKRKVSEEEYVKILETENKDLKAQLAATNADMQAFMEHLINAGILK